MPHVAESRRIGERTRDETSAVPNISESAIEDKVHVRRVSRIGKALILFTEGGEGKRRTEQIRWANRKHGHRISDADPFAARFRRESAHGSMCALHNTNGFAIIAHPARTLSSLS